MSSSPPTSTYPCFQHLQFVNRAVKSLPIDPKHDNRTREVPNACFSPVNPTPLKAPVLVAASKEALALLDITELDEKALAAVFSGNELLPGSFTAAHCYCGYQFGNFAGQLGDGAAIYLGEVQNKLGEKWEIQLKGAGMTPYSRQADGRKVLRSSLREFVCSEAMFHLGIPTTRAGTLVTSDSYVIRDKLYSGDAIQERCSVVLRIAQTFIRFGSFEIAKPADPTTGRSGPSEGNTAIVKKLMDYVIENLFPEIWSQDISEHAKYKEFYRQVVIRTANLVAHWQTVGFCHGVLNTDNMSIYGLTIDYGPFGFLDRYNPYHICNGSDHHGRYDFKSQPDICYWNLYKLAEALQDLLPLKDAHEELKMYFLTFKESYLRIMRNKLGLLHPDPADEALFQNLLIQWR